MSAPFSHDSAHLTFLASEVQRRAICQIGASLMESASPLLTKDFQVLYGGRDGERGGCSRNVLYERRKRNRKIEKFFGKLRSFWRIIFNGTFLNSHLRMEPEWDPDMHIFNVFL